MAPATYGKTWWREGYACGCMIISIEQVIEPRLRAAGHLGPNETVNIFQQAYSSSVSASAGTHAGGGSLDHEKGNDAETIIWRECGVADWQRGSPEDTAFDDHNHGIWQGCPHLSGDAEGQIDQYNADCNGLSGWGPDQSPDVKPITWQAAYDKYASSAPPAEEGLLGMGDLERHDTSKDRWIEPGDWALVLIEDDDSSTYFTGPGTFVANTYIQFEGLAFGNDPVRARYGRLKENGDIDYYPQKEIFGSEGTSFGEITLVNWMPEKQKLRLYVQVPYKIKTTYVYASVLHD
jgi:hypothetical protein